MKLAVVILNWNGRKLLEQFLPVVIEYSKNSYTEIYVADNSSDDDSVSFIRQNFKDVHIICNENNDGFAKGYNDALQDIDADIYALLNSDIQVTENWLDPIMDQFKNNCNTAIIQPKILDFKDSQSFEYAGAAGGFIDSLGYPYCRGRIFTTLEKDLGQYNVISDIFWASGACFFIRSEVFHKLGGFDNDYFAHQEEIDLCWRAHNRGHTIQYVGNTTVYHIGGATLNEMSSTKTFLNFRNSLYTLVKNLPGNKIAFVILTRLILDGIAGVKFFFELRPKHTWAILRAHFSFYGNLRKMLRKRNGKPTSQYYSVKSIVWKYYILGKKSFKSVNG